MRRVLVVILVLAAAGAYLLTASGAKQESGNQFTVEFDNAFGLVKGGDVKVAGVRAGQVTNLRVDHKTKRALIDFKLTKQGFGDLRTDTYCESRPQSLIGEYFIDCTPGKSPTKLKPGATIPVKQTASTIPADLLADIMRRPYRERLRIILNELGAGVGGRADDVNATIRRASPALRETDRVLTILARQNQVLKDLTTNADTVVGDLAGNHHDVGRFVKEAEDAATTSAERRRDLAAGLHRLPTFLRELRPTMAELGATADASTPYLRDLNASAGQLTRFLDNLGPFSESSRVNVRTLAKTADVGRPAIRSARPDRRRAHQDDREGARARQQPRDRAARPRRPQPRRREGQALARRPGLHRLRGGPLLHLRPDDGDQHLRRERPHPEGQPLRVGVQRLPERRLAQAQGEAEPRLHQALPRRPRPQPAGRHDRPTRPTPASTIRARARAPRTRGPPRSPSAMRASTRRRARTRPGSPTSRRRSSGCWAAAVAPTGPRPRCRT